MIIWPSRPNFRKQIARIEISGTIAAATRRQVLAGLKTIEECKFPALLLCIDSPGGTKVIASLGNISALGGVYVGVSADHVVANSGTITGSIGVILRSNNLELLTP